MKRPNDSPQVRAGRARPPAQKGAARIPAASAASASRFKFFAKRHSPAPSARVIVSGAGDEGGRGGSTTSKRAASSPYASNSPRTHAAQSKKPAHARTAGAFRRARAPSARRIIVGKFVQTAKRTAGERTTHQKTKSLVPWSRASSLRAIVGKFRSLRLRALGVSWRP